MTQALELEVLVVDGHASWGVTRLQQRLKSLDVKLDMCFGSHPLCVGLI